MFSDSARHSVEQQLVPIGLGRWLIEALRAAPMHASQRRSRRGGHTRNGCCRGSDPSIEGTWRQRVSHEAFRGCASDLGRNRGRLCPVQALSSRSVDVAGQHIRFGKKNSGRFDLSCRDHAARCRRPLPPLKAPSRDACVALRRRVRWTTRYGGPQDAEDQGFLNTLVDVVKLRGCALAERGKLSATSAVPVSAPLWSPVHPETLSWRIVAQVRAALFSGQLKPGDLLGSEGSLAQQFQVSRMAARDALRSLEAVGIVEIRMGLKGGAWIAQGNANRFADSLSIQLQLIGVTAQEILDTQLAMDPVAAGLAAAVVSAQDIVRLEAAASACQQHVADPDAFTDASINFHELVIECSRNRLLLAQFRALRSVLEPLVRPKTTDDVMQRLMRSNQALIRALAGGDAAEAARLMRDRVSAMRASLLGVKVVSKNDAARTGDPAND